MREILFGHEHTRVRGTDMESIPEYPHLKFSNIEHYKAALAYAEKLGEKALASFKHCFSEIERWEVNNYYGDTAEIHPDFAKHSFYFRAYTKEGKCMLDGGIILSEQYAEPSWNIHT